MLISHIKIKILKYEKTKVNDWLLEFIEGFEDF
jgi:hypothetical protein